MSALSGVRVVELARILAGPWIGQTLADLGADVVKVESPEGDDTRRWGPPFIEAEGERAAAYYHSCNRGKRGIVADFSTTRGREIARRLALRSDVLIENFKVGGLKKYGLDYETLSALNPRLVYCSVTGFGQTGPYAERAGYDYLMQGMSGFMDITGEPDGPPMRAGVAISDLFTGLYGVVAIEAALIARERTGRGQHIDLALLDTTAAILANQAMNFLASGVDARAHRGRASQPCALPDVSGRGRLDHHRGRQRRAVRDGFAPRSGSTRSPRTRASPPIPQGTRTVRRSPASSPQRQSDGGATRSSPRSKKPSCRPDRSTASRTYSPIRNSSRAACASRRRERRACAARSS